MAKTPTKFPVMRTRRSSSQLPQMTASRLSPRHSKKPSPIKEVSKGKESDTKKKESRSTKTPARGSKQTQINDVS